MKKIFNTIMICLAVVGFASCEPQEDAIGNIGPAATGGKVAVNTADPFNPIFTVSDAQKALAYGWDMANGEWLSGNQVTSYYPFPGTYNVTCFLYGAGARGPQVVTKYTVTQTDPALGSKPYLKELTGSGAGKTWVYNTNTETGEPDYCFQTTGDLVNYPDNWMPAQSWGQCVRITPDIKGEMVFDLNGGFNYTYHHVAGDAGVKGKFVFNKDKMTLTIKNPFILDYNIACTNPKVTPTGVYEVKKLTDDEMVIWQMQDKPAAGPGSGTGWSWSFKRKGSNP